MGRYGFKSDGEGAGGSSLKLSLLDWPEPDFSTSCRSQKDLTAAISYIRSDGALHLLIDCTGSNAVGRGTRRRRHGAS